MLLCGLAEVTEGMVVAASVLHPRRPDVELLSSGVPLERAMIKRLRGLNVTSVWVHHDATRDLAELIDPSMGKARRAAYEQLRRDFAHMSTRTVTTSHIATYRQIVLDLICELIADRRVAGLTEQLVGGPTGLFTHSSSVAYLSILVGLQLETYIVQQRAKLDYEHARDVTALGIGAMLHDIGKAACDPAVLGLHDATIWNDDGELLIDDEERLAAYRDHVKSGYRMLRGSRAPASATQVVLTHHQRWDGNGFPDMSGCTEGRCKGPQRQEQIHIFSRIVAAANTLDNLLRDAEGQRRPPVAALRDLASPKFDGWFDPVVRDAVLRCIPPFAVGSKIVLSDGREAAVIAPSVEQPCRPLVRMLGDRRADGTFETINLRERPELHVAECAGVKVQPYLFSLPEQKPRLMTIAKAS